MDVKRRTELDREVSERYGEHVPRAVQGEFVLVFLDASLGDDARERLAEEFFPDFWFFDDCPICTRFLKEGGIMLFTVAGVTAVRSRLDGEPEEVEFIRGSGVGSSTFQ